MPQQTEHFIGTVDVRELHEFDWPMLRLLAPSFVERLETIPTWPGRCSTKWRG